MNSMHVARASPQTPSYNKGHAKQEIHSRYEVSIVKGAIKLNKREG